MNIFIEQYKKWVLINPWPLLIVLLVILGCFAWHAQDFRLDASADSLLLDDDQDLKAYRELSDRYGSKNFLVVAIVPDAPLFNRATLDQMESLASELTEIPGVESVNSILDVPLLSQSGGSLTELAGNFRTLRDPDVDFDRARMSGDGNEILLTGDVEVEQFRSNDDPGNITRTQRLLVHLDRDS